MKSDFLAELAAVEHQINGDPTRTQTHVVNVSFPGVDSEALMMAVREELAISNGAACTSASYSPSHVLKAMGLSDDLIASAVRISWGPEITRIPAEPIIAAVRSMRAYARENVLKVPLPTLCLSESHSDLRICRLLGVVERPVRPSLYHHADFFRGHPLLKHRFLQAGLKLRLANRERNAHDDRHDPTTQSPHHSGEPDQFARMEFGQ